MLYIDEVNLLDPLIIDAILDAAAQGQYTVRRGPMAATYRSRLTLVGSMNPEEGILRPQIQDRFGLRVLIRGVQNLDERMEIYRRAVFYKHKPYKFVTDWLAETELAQGEVIEARKRLPKVKFGPGVEREGLRWIQELKIDSHRAELTLFEAGRALAAADGRLEVTLDDLRTIGPMALRQRQTETAQRFFEAQLKEDQSIQSIITGSPKAAAKKPRAKKPARPTSPEFMPTYNGAASVSADDQETPAKNPEAHQEKQSGS